MTINFHVKYRQFWVCCAKYTQRVFANLPVNWCCNFVAIGQLNWVDHSQDLAVKLERSISITIYYFMEERNPSKNSLFPKARAKPYSKLRPDDAGYRMDKRSLRFGSITKTARHVNVIPLALTSSRSSILSLIAKSQFESSMIGYGNAESASSPPYDLMSSIHFKCDSAESIDSAIGFTLRFWNSG